jgi:hypothetical protein
MVGVKFNGRLGNQLFQYFFLEYLRSRDGSKFYFFSNANHAYLTKYFDFGWYDNLLLSPGYFSLLGRGLNKLLGFKDVFIHNFFAPKHLTPENYTIYNGYFQSDFYLQHLDKRPKVRLRKKYKDAFDAEFGDIFKNNKTVVVHIRRTDYLTYGKRDISLPIAYFKKQLSTIQSADQYKIFFVSDDMEFVRNEFPAKSNYIFSSNSEIIDFQLIQNADIAIISNSTFAWWAAYLCPKNNIVIAPEKWFGFRIGREHPRGIMTDKFEWKRVL